METAKFIELVKAEPEYPDPCPKLRAFVKEAVAKQDEDWVIHMLRQAVRQTKESIIKRVAHG
jgi:hypothetical protein